MLLACTADAHGSPTPASVSSSSAVAIMARNWRRLRRLVGLVAAEQGAVPFLHVTDRTSVYRRRPTGARHVHATTHARSRCAWQALSGPTALDETRGKPAGEVVVQLDGSWCGGQRSHHPGGRLSNIIPTHTGSPACSRPEQLPGYEDAPAGRSPRPSIPNQVLAYPQTTYPSADVPDRTVASRPDRGPSPPQVVIVTGATSS